MTAVYKYDTTNTSRKNLTSNFLAENTHSARWYSYFGSRYYDSNISIWISVDPKASKYASTNAYMYCLGSPIRYIDPNGEEISDHTDLYGNMIAHYDDGDNGVYMHANGTTKAQIDAQRTANNNTGGTGTRIGEMGGNINVSTIMQNKLEQSAGEAKGMGLMDYYHAVKTGGKWDLKNNENTIFGVAWHTNEKTTFSFDGYSGLNAADVGNYHAGYTGQAASISPYFLWKGAGFAETTKAWGNGNRWEAIGRGLLLLNPIHLSSGDKPRDFYWNTKGMWDINVKRWTR